MRLTVALARHNAPIKPPISPAAPRGLRHCLKSITEDINTASEIVNNYLGRRKTRTCEIQIQNNIHQNINTFLLSFAWCKRAIVKLLQAELHRRETSLEKCGSGAVDDSKVPSLSPPSLSKLTKF